MIQSGLRKRHYRSVPELVHAADETTLVFDHHDLYRDTIIVLSSILMINNTTTIILPDLWSASRPRPTIGHTSRALFVSPSRLRYTSDIATQTHYTTSAFRDRPTNSPPSSHLIRPHARILLLFPTRTIAAGSALKSNIGPMKSPCWIIKTSKNAPPSH